MIMIIDPDELRNSYIDFDKHYVHAKSLSTDVGSHMAVYLLLTENGESFTPFWVRGDSLIEECCFVHCITGNGGSTVYADLMGIVKNGFNGGNGYTGDTDDNAIIHDTLSTEGYPWHQSCDDNLTKDGYAITSKSAILLPGYMEENTLVSPRNDALVAIKRINPENIDMVYIKLNGGIDKHNLEILKRNYMGEIEGSGFAGEVRFSR